MHICSCKTNPSWPPMQCNEFQASCHGYGCSYLSLAGAETPFHGRVLEVKPLVASSSAIDFPRRAVTIEHSTTLGLKTCSLLSIGYKVFDMTLNQPLEENFVSKLCMFLSWQTPSVKLKRLAKNFKMIKNRNYCSSCPFLKLQNGQLSSSSCYR